MHELERRSDSGDVYEGPSRIEIGVFNATRRHSDKDRHTYVQLILSGEFHKTDVLLTPSEVDDLCLILQYYKKVGENNDESSIKE